MLFSASSCVSQFSSLTNLQLLYDVSTNSVGKLNSPVHDAASNTNLIVIQVSWDVTLRHWLSAAQYFVGP
jgi:hypothetical protein